MEIIKKLSGWTLSKDDKNYIITTDTNHVQTYGLHYSNVIVSRFEEIMKRGWVWVDYEYFTVHFYMNEIVVRKEAGQVSSDKFKDLNRMYPFRFLDKQSAINAINKVLPKAQEKFNKCSKALCKLHKDLGFISGDSYEGDTHGTYNDHSYISFDMEGFSFSFINN